MVILSNKTLTSQEPNNLKVVFEQDVCVGSQKNQINTCKSITYWSIKEDSAYLTELLEKVGFDHFPPFADSNNLIFSHKIAKRHTKR